MRRGICTRELWRAEPVEVDGTLWPSQFHTMSELMKTPGGLAYRFVDGTGPVLLFLPGYMSDMGGSKATALFAWAALRGRRCLLMDYSGCGASDGEFLQGSISCWTTDALAVLDHVAPREQVVLIGSSMGGWIALRAGLRLGGRLAGLACVAAAPDFPDWGLDMAAHEAQALAAHGHFSRPSGYGGDYRYSKAFLDDAARCRMLAGPIGITAPVRLVHGQCDDAVPWRLSLEIAERLLSSDVQVMLIKDGDHRLSRDHDIALLLALVDGLK